MVSNSSGASYSWTISIGFSSSSMMITSGSAVGDVGTWGGTVAGGAMVSPPSLSSSSFSPISSSEDWIIPSSFAFSSVSFLAASSFYLHRASSSRIFLLASSPCSPSCLISFMASSTSQTKARVNFTWLAKHLMWSQSSAGNTTASAPSRACLRKCQYCECSIWSSSL
jgi:hypothetical protein